MEKEQRGLEKEQRGLAKRQRAQMVIGVVATALVTAFALSNSQRVTVDWLVTSTESRLIFVIVASVIVGGVMGFAIARRPPRA